MQIKCTVELFGLLGGIAKKKEVEIILKEGCNCEDVIITLGRYVPGLIGLAISREGKALLTPYVMNINGRLFIDDFKHCIRDGDRVLLMYPPSGG